MGGYVCNGKCFPSCSDCSGGVYMGRRVDTSPEATTTTQWFQDQLRRRDLDVNDLEMQLERAQTRINQLNALLSERGLALSGKEREASK